MLNSISCSLDPFIIAGKIYVPIPWGKERRFRRVPGRPSCPDCGAPPARSITTVATSRNARSVTVRRSVAAATSGESGITPDHDNSDYDNVVCFAADVAGVRHLRHEAGPCSLGPAVSRTP